jgi:TonB family protein
MTLTNDKAIALTGTIIAHLALLFLFLVFGMETSKPAGEEGLLVNFGNINEAAGLFEPEGVRLNPAESVPPEKTAERQPEEMITQDMEKSISITKKNVDSKAEQKRITEERVNQEQDLKAAEIRKQTASVFARSKSGNSESQGTAASGFGNQGSTNGSTSSTNMSSGGGRGYGNFSLSGRSINGFLPLPNYSIQEEGIVVVQIIVNPKGNVISAAISLQGTNTDNSTLRSAALNAAKQARFNTIQGNENQGGTITYQYRLK